MLIPLETVNNFIYENFERVKVSKNGTHYHCRCAICGDSKKSLSKKRFHLDYNNGEPIWHCFNCNKAGNFVLLYSLIKHVSIEEATRMFKSFDSDSIKNFFKKKKFKKQPVKTPNISYHDYILNDCISLDDNVSGVILPLYQKQLKAFVESRNVFDYKLYVAYQGHYKGRIIIPIYDDDNKHIIFFQGRTITGDLKKYDNPPVEKSYIVLNCSKFDKDKYIIVTEGIFDALSVGNQGTTCFGASVSDDYIQLINKKTDKGIIIALDNDKTGIDEMNRIMEESKYSNILRFFLMPKEYSDIKDINMLDGKVKNIYDFVINNSYSKFEYIIKMGLRRKN